VSKYVRKVDRPQVFWESFLDAVATALAGRPGPAVLLIPRSLYMTEVGDVPADLAGAIAKRIQPRVPSEAELHAILDELRLSRRSVLIVGQGVQRTRIRNSLFEFAEAIDIPVATTMAARGEFPNDHKNYLGVLGVAGHPSTHAFVRDECDLLLLAGAGLNTMTRAPFARDVVDLPQKRIVAISADLGELERVVLSKPKESAKESTTAEYQPKRSWWPNAVNSVAVGVEADVGAAFEALLELWKAQPFKVRAVTSYLPTAFAPSFATTTPRDGFTAFRLEDYVNKAPAKSDPEDEGPMSHPLALATPEVVESIRFTHSGDGKEPLLQSVALEVLGDHLPTKGTVLYDAGNCAAAALHAFSIPRDVASVIALGMGGMGYAIAAAIGTQLGAPEASRTVVFTGDGSFLMVGMEIHTAVDLRLPILYIVFNNNMHGMCATRQNVFFESRYECVTYGPIDIAQVARGFGTPANLWIGKAATPNQLHAALEDFERDPMRPGVLELCLDIEEVPPFTPFLEKEPKTKRMRTLAPKKE
jgi:acetolactate synthase-1/2/3 large subunit